MRPAGVVPQARDQRPPPRSPRGQAYFSTVQFTRPASRRRGWRAAAAPGASAGICPPDRDVRYRGSRDCEQLHGREACGVCARTGAVTAGDGRGQAVGRRHHENHYSSFSAVLVGLGRASTTSQVAPSTSAPPAGALPRAQRSPRTALPAPSAARRGAPRAAAAAAAVSPRGLPGGADTVLWRGGAVVAVIFCGEGRDAAEVCGGGARHTELERCGDGPAGGRRAVWRG